MKIRKVYVGVNPELLFAEVKDFVQRQGAGIGEAKLETYSLPNDSSDFVMRATLTFKGQPGPDKTVKECLTAHILGSAKSDVRLMLDTDEGQFSAAKLASLLEDLDFVFGKYEQKPK